MRIDYFLVSEALKDRIVACEIHGRGIELNGAIYFITDPCITSHNIFLDACYSLYIHTNTYMNKYPHNLFEIHHFSFLDLHICFFFFVSSIDFYLLL